MEDLSFNRKYRPATLADYIGNAKVKEDVFSYLSKPDKKPQVFLLYGASGCGKTTLARLLAKEYSCENRDIEKGACGECEACKRFDEYITTGNTGALPNVREVNIAEQSGKNDLDDVKQEIQLPSYDGEWRVYIFDECHMATQQAQNSMLKMVEDIPQDVLLIFCTTNPEKIIDTLYNRMQRKLQITKPTLSELSVLLQKVCHAEGIEFDNEGINLICQRSEFCIRDALMKLEEVYLACGDALSTSVMKQFESISTREIAKFVNALTKKDILQYVTCLSEIKERMLLPNFLKELKKFIINGVYVVNSVKIEGLTNAELDMYRGIFANYGIDKLTNLLHSVLKLNSNDIEYDLIALGYMGIDYDDKQDAPKSVIKMDREIEAERANEGAVLEVKHEAEKQEAIKNTSSAFDEITLDELLGSGAEIVKE